MKENQLKNLAWNTFKQTGDINTFIELMQVESIQKNNHMESIEETNQNKIKNIEETQYGNYQNQGHYPFGK